MKTLALAFIFALFACADLTAKTLDLDTTLATTSGSIRTNAKQVIMIFSATYAGTVNGVTYTSLAGGSINLAANQDGDQINTITYTITAGSITILRLQ